MSEPKNEFANVNMLRPEALGNPGERTFRILVDSGSSSAIMWLEKEQLLQLALGMQQLLTMLPEGQGAQAASSASKEAPGLTRLDFKVGKVVLGHDRASGLFVLDVHEVEADDEPPTIRVWGQRAQISAFANDALKVCAAGRPLCPLCGGPIERDGHACPRANGHRTLADVVDS